jgi:NOL1/NOP2/fmu family ribosome biogenesis protein
VARSGLEVADVFRRYGEAYRQTHAAVLSSAQHRVMSAIELSRDNLDEKRRSVAPDDSH